MYLNKDNSTQAHVDKGKLGETIFAKWCEDHNVTYRHATKDEDYLGKIDFFITADLVYSVSVKNNYVAEYDNVVIEWEQIINELKILSSTEVVEIINEFFNRTIYQQVDNKEEIEYDYWQSPIETLVKGSGDCEDFVMAKYVSLRLLGIPAEQLLISLIHYPEYNDTHAVLLFFPKVEIDPLVLDNVVFQHLGYMKSHLLTLSHRMIKHNIKPILGFNEEKFISFTNGMNQKVIGTDPCNEYRQFGIAVNNSNRVLP